MSLPPPLVGPVCPFLLFPLSLRLAPLAFSVRVPRFLRLATLCSVPLGIRERPLSRPDAGRGFDRSG